MAVVPAVRAPEGVPVVEASARAMTATAAEVVPVTATAPARGVEVGGLALAMTFGVVQAASPVAAAIASLAALGRSAVLQDPYDAASVLVRPLRDHEQLKVLRRHLGDTSVELERHLAPLK